MSPIWYSILDRYTQKSCLNLSSLLWSSQTLRLSLFCLLNVAFALQVSLAFLFSVIRFLLYFYSLLFCYVFCLCVCCGLKPICSLTVCFLFPALWIACLCLLEFPCSASSSLYNAAQRSGHLTPYELSVSFL